MALNTFDIEKEYRALIGLVHEVDEEGKQVNDVSVLQEYIDNLEDTRFNKLNKLEDARQVEIALATAAREKVRKLQARIRAHEVAVRNIRNLQEMLTEGESIKTDEYTFYYRRSESIEVVNEHDIPDSCISLITKVHKDRIKELIASGEDVAGVSVVKRMILGVK